MSFENGWLDDDGRPVDRLGRRHPHRFNAVIFGRAIPGFWDQFRSVPASHYRVDDATAVVSCPCGSQPAAITGNLTRCDGCERIFLFSGRELLVANSPARIKEEAIA